MIYTFDSGSDKRFFYYENNYSAGGEFITLKDSFTVKELKFSSEGGAPEIQDIDDDEYTCSGLEYEEIYDNHRV